ncbi:ATP-binding cassette domain-containing protein [Devosia sp. 2618]|uniref:ATP-binding cassette domain-containing protein n=1 Tax=Devosia sp. 2618 TaxID=3156454 RepID=UPI00339445A5
MAQQQQLPLAVEGIVKTFPGVKALGGVSFDCRPGEIHALVGENGAGKSTLMRVLTGVYRPDAGTILIDGKPVTLTGPADSADHGIAMVYQDTNLVPDLDAVQNIFLGREPGGAIIDYAAMREAARSVLARLGEDIDLRERVGDKPLAEKQIIELARGLSRNARVLILDEPTSALTPREVDKLFAILRTLRAQGTSIIFISHRLPEIFAIADRITVLKDGQMVGSVDAATTSADQIVTMMVGRELSLTYPPRATSVGETVLGVSHISGVGAFKDVSFEVHAGEIVGLGGIAGSGQQDIVRSIFGLTPASGSITINGVKQSYSTPSDAIKAGVVYLPSDRRGEGMFLPHSISSNIVLPHIKDWSRFGVLDNAREREAVAAQVAALRVKTPNVQQPVELLSGGNQQKVTFARWLLANPKICIFDEPTQGVDVGTKAEIYTLMRQLAQRGIAIIVVSSDVQELIGISDRILVVANGSIVDEVPGATATEERIIGSAVKSVEAGVVPEKPVSIRKPPATPAARLFGRYGATLLLLAITVGLCAYASLATPYFLTPRNFASLAVQIAPLVFVALGQFAVIALGGIDLSAGPNISLSTAIASFLLVAGAPFGLAGGLVIVLAAGLLVGLLNAILIQGLKLPDLVATLATYSVVAGLALIVRPAPGGLLDSSFTDLVLIRVGNVPVVFIVAVLAVLAFELLLLRGKLGLRLMATGSNANAAYVAGVKTGRVRLAAYMFCGFMAAVAGVIIASRIGSGDPQAGTVFTLMSVTAVVLGGTSVFGGKGTALGVFVAACLLMVIQNAMNHLQISAYWQYVLTGGLTLAAVAIYAARSDGKWRDWLTTFARLKRTD